MFEKINQKSCDRLPLKIFIASPDDMKKQRDLIKKVFSEVHSIRYKNFGLPLYWIYRWEDNKKAGYVGQSEDQYQNEIFEEFGNWCDIFILITGKKYGKGTIIEYNYYKNIFKIVNNNCKLLPFHVPHLSDWKDKPVDIELQQWINENEKDFALGGKSRLSIKNPKQLETEIKEQENLFANSRW